MNCQIAPQGAGSNWSNYDLITAKRDCPQYLTVVLGIRIVWELFSFGLGVCCGEEIGFGIGTLKCLLQGLKTLNSLG